MPLGLQYSGTFWTSGSLTRPWARGLPCSRRLLFLLLSPGVQAGRGERCADNMARPGERASPPAAWLPGAAAAGAWTPAPAWLLDQASHGAWASPGPWQSSGHAAALRPGRQSKANALQAACTEQMISPH